VPLDALDAELTLQSAIDTEERARQRGGEMTQIEAAWRAKGELVAQRWKLAH
jgi:hypothetical protein